MRGWRLLKRAGLDDAVRQGYFRLRAAPHGYRYRTRIGDASAEFEMATWIEYKRVKNLHGERAVLERLLDDLDEDGVFWDVGANVGIYSCLAADTAPAGAVVGFEPEPENRRRLRENLAASDPACEWTVSPIALWDRDATARLAAGFDEADRVVGAGHYYLDVGDDAEDHRPQSSGRDPAVATVECRRAETLVEQGLPAPEVVKVDVQGAELQVLRGFGDALAGVETAYVELHTEKTGRYGTTAVEAEAFLREAGFALEEIGEPDGFRGGVYHVRATRE